MQNNIQKEYDDSTWLKNKIFLYLDNILVIV